ncbi:MAG: VOC family protein [Acholeplasmatales bacterium]|nr:MAG: VOC family protein [Acholeplasmatales bacterium]
MNRLNLITLGVKDVKQSFAFYKALGFQTTHDQAAMPDMVTFANQGTTLSLYPLDALRMDISESEAPIRQPGFTGMTMAYFCKTQAEVDTVLANAVTHGGTLLKPAEHVFWGGYRGYFADLDGYVFEVAYSEHFVFDKQDRVYFT